MTVRYPCNMCRLLKLNMTCHKITQTQGLISKYPKITGLTHKTKNHPLQSPSISLDRGFQSLPPLPNAKQNLTEDPKP